MTTLRCLRTLIAFPILALIACSQTRFDDVRSQRVQPTIREKSESAEHNPSFQENPSSPKPISGESEAPPTPPLTVGEDVIPPEPAVSPAVVAGASLTCIRQTGAETSVECQAFSYEAKVDLVPHRVYIFDDSIKFWIETDFKRVHVGRYRISVFEGMGEKIALAISYGNGEIVYGETAEKSDLNLSIFVRIPESLL